MAERHFTPKQVRGARERQGILVERSGSGSNMLSTWRLPIGAQVTAAPDDKNMSKPDIGGDETLPTEGEQRRHQARMEAFTGHGIDAHTARRVADALVLRDRAGLPAMGSCAECQCVSLNCCPTAPRQAIDIHECWYRRQWTP